MINRPLHIDQDSIIDRVRLRFNYTESYEHGYQKPRSFNGYKKIRHG